MKLASIEIIADISPHPNADALDVAKILGWQTIVKKGQFKVGDRVVFIVIDTILPDAPWSEFLKKGDSKIRLKTIKLRGQYSQGLTLPITVLDEHAQTWQVGADVGGLLGIKKYEKEIPVCLAGDAKCNFPLHIAPKTDEDNGLSNPDIVEYVLRKPCIATLKLDGSSCTIIVESGVIQHVCSRNLSLKESDRNGFWIAAKKLKLDGFKNLIIQGELMGPGVQGNQLGLTEPTLFVYQVKLDSKQWSDYDEMRAIAMEIGAHYVESIQCDMVGVDIPFLQKLADSVTLPNGQPAEGIVVRQQAPESTGNGRPLGFKIINRNYKDT